MNTITQLGIKKLPKYSKLLQWGKLITITGTGQVLVQLFGLISGVLIIRLLPIQEYAWYTVANTLLGTMTILADSGISAGVMSEGGKVWQDKNKLGEVIATGLDLRRKFAVVSLLVGIPILIYLLLHHKASYLTAVLIAVSLIPSFFAALSDSLLEITPKLHQDITPLQKNQLLVGIGRFLFVLSLFIFPFTFIAVIANGIPRMYGNIRLKTLTGKYITPHSKPNVEIRKSILKIVSKTLPNAIYYCVSGQISIFLLSFFGNSNSLGTIGALSRLTMVLTVFSTIFATLISPRFARLKNDYRLLLKRYTQIMLLNVLFISGLIFLTYLFSNQLIFLLGKQYKNLNYELLLCVIAGCGNLWVGYNSALTLSRGWILNPYFTIFIDVVALIVGISIFNFTTLRGALYYNLFLGAISITMGTTFCMYKILKQKNSLVSAQ